MKDSFLLALFLAAALPVFAQTVPTPNPSTNNNPQAEAEFNAMWTALRANPPEGLTRTNREYWKWEDGVFKNFLDDAHAFAKKYPTDPRRWDGLVQSGYTSPRFLSGFKPDFETNAAVTNLIVDQAAIKAFTEHQQELDHDVVLAADSTARQRIGAFQWLLVQAQTVATAQGRKADFTQFEPLMMEAGTKFPDERAAALLEIYVELLRQTAADHGAAFEAKIADLPVNKAMKEMAVKAMMARVSAHEAMLKAIADIGTMSFTAADGATVDLAKLRGKVVLIDFWATWCGPCVREIPNVVATYKKYHDQGFEVVGVSLENSGVEPTDAAEVREKKLATAKEKMLAFTKVNEMPWPQYYDGKYVKNEYAVKYMIQAIPATVLLDKQGKIVSTEARGPNLEKEVQRLLAL